MATPFARSSVYEPNHTLAGLVMRQGEQSAQNWQNVGNVVAGSLRDIATGIREAPIRRQQQEAQQIEIENARAAQSARRQQTEDASIMRSAQSSTLAPEQVKAQLQQLGRGDLVPVYEQAQTALETSRQQLRKLKDDTAAAEIDYFGGLASAIKRAKYDPLAVEWALSEADADGHDTAAIRQTLKDNPQQLQTIVDGLIERSPKQRELAAKDAETALRGEDLALRRTAEDRQRAKDAADAADRAADNVRADAQLRVSQGTLDVARQNAQTSRMQAETTRNRYSRAGVDLGVVPPEYANSLDRAILMVPQTRRANVVALANRLAAEGKTDELKDVIRQAAIDSENVDTKNQILGRRATMASLRDAGQILREMKAKGVPTNILSGTLEDVARKLGTSTNTEYVAFANRLQGTLINYRRAATGVAFGQRESEQYEKMFPNYKNTLPVNEALISGLEREMQTYDNEYWTHKLGKDGAALVGVVASPGGGGGTSGAPKADPLGIR